MITRRHLFSSLLLQFVPLGRNLIRVQRYRLGSTEPPAPGLPAPINPFPYYPQSVFLPGFPGIPYSKDAWMFNWWSGERPWPISYLWVRDMNPGFQVRKSAALLWGERDSHIGFIEFVKPGAELDRQENNIDCHFVAVDFVDSPYQNRGADRTRGVSVEWIIKE